MQGAGSQPINGTLAPDRGVGANSTPALDYSEEAGGWERAPLLSELDPIPRRRKASILAIRASVFGILARLPLQIVQRHALGSVYAPQESSWPGGL